MHKLAHRFRLPVLAAGLVSQVQSGLHFIILYRRIMYERTHM
jgi:hypothetical protein